MYRAVSSAVTSAPLCRGVNLIRIDAFGYTTKKKGTNCFFVEPEIWQLLDHVRDVLSKLDSPAELLCELHEHYIMQVRTCGAVSTHM